MTQYIAASVYHLCQSAPAGNNTCFLSASPLPLCPDQWGRQTAPATVFSDVPSSPCSDHPEFLLSTCFHGSSWVRDYGVLSFPGTGRQPFASSQTTAFRVCNSRMQSGQEGCVGFELILSFPGGWIPNKKWTVAFFLFHVFALTRDLDFVTQHCWDLAGICKYKSCIKRSFSQ